MSTIDRVSGPKFSAMLWRFDVHEIPASPGTSNALPPLAHINALETGVSDHVRCNPDRLEPLRSNHTPASHRRRRTDSPQTQPAWVSGLRALQEAWPPLRRTFHHVLGTTR